MAAARERNENGNLYDDGGGFGKFRKRPFRRPQTTPYDRPPTAIRHGGDNGNGWLSRLVDPAHRLINSCAHKLFASVFRKRLPRPPTPPPLEPESNEGAGNEQQEAVPKDLPGIEGVAVSGCDNLIRSSDGGEITQLEIILKQKTFTRSEIDRLTALLQSKTVDPVVGNEEKKSELPSTLLLSHDRKDSPNTPVKLLNATPTVLDEDVASPAELAKAYMGSRPSKVSSSMLGLRSQQLRETSMEPANFPFSLKSPAMTVVPRSSGRTGLFENGFVTPRSRGRSAIYSMARTPYSRVYSTTTFRGAGTATDASSRPSSSSHGAWESNRSSGSKQGALKRRISVLDNDIGAVGPIRRIRQKSNLLPSSGALVLHGTAFSSDAADRPSLSEKDIVGEKSKENGDNGIHISGFTPGPSKSTAMASKILHQLDVLVSSRDKSPSKLSPSMLRGPALRSLENVDSSKFFENFQDNNKLDVSRDTSLHDAPDSLRQKQDIVEANGPTKLIASYEKPTSAVNNLVTSSSMENNVPGAKTVAITVTSSSTQPHPHKKHAFQMIAHEDYLDLDDDNYVNGPMSATLAEGREKQDSSLNRNKHSAIETALVEKPPSLPEVIPSTSSVLSQQSTGASAGSLFTEKGSSFSFSGTPLPSVTTQHSIIDGQSTEAYFKAASTKELNGTSPIFRLGDKVIFSEEPNGASSLPNFSSKTTNKIVASSSVGTDSSDVNLIPSSDTKPGSSSSFASVAAGEIERQTKGLQSGEGEIKNSLNPGGVSNKPETAPSAALTVSPNSSIFFSGSPVNGSSLSNGLFSSPSSFPTQSPALIPNNIIGQSSSTSTMNVVANGSSAVIAATLTADTSSNSSSLESAPSFTAASISKFGFSVVPATSSLSASANIAVESTEDKIKGTSFGSLISAPFAGTSATTTSAASSLLSGTSATTSTGSGIFSGRSSAITNSGSKGFTGTSATTSTGSNIFSGTLSAITSTGSSLFSSTSAETGTGSSIFSFNAGATTAAAANQSKGFNPFVAGSTQASVAGTAFAASTQSTPSQFVSCAPSLTFGLTGNPTFSSSSTTSNAAKLFSSGPTFGLTSSTSASEPNSVGSSTSTTATVFGSGWQTAISSGFGSTFNTSLSTGFAFTASSTPNVAINNASMAFGSSTGASSGSTFSFSSSAVATPAATPSFPFSSAPSGNNDQMNMEDSMAEDTMNATAPAVPVFSQQSVATGAGFIFGAAPAAGNPFPSTTPPGGNIFQFGKQPTMVTPQNPSPFQASGSFDAGGAFSLGTSGGEKSTRKFVKVRKTHRKK